MKPHFIWHIRIKPGETIKTREGLFITNNNDRFSAHLTIASDAKSTVQTKDETNEQKAKGQPG